MLAPRGFGADAMLPSVYTGADPSEHGRYYHSQETLGDTGPGAASNLHTECETVWSVLQREGKKTVVLDLPKAPFGEGFDGVQVANWRTHTSSMRDFKTAPPELADRLVREFGPHTDCPCYAHRYDKFDPSTEDTWLTEMHERLDAQYALARSHVRKPDWDLLMVGFCVGHCVGHQFWHLHDTKHPLYPPQRPTERDPIRLVYQRLDAVVGGLLGLVGADTRVMLFAGPGIGSSYLRWDLLDDILLKLSHGRRPADKHFLQTLKTTWHRLPDRLRRALSGIAHKTENSLGDYGRQRRPYYPARLNDAVAGIIINRELVSDHAAVRRVADFLLQELAGVVNLDTGTPIVEDIFVTSDEYHGAYLGRMPDIMIVWDNDTRVRRVGSPSIGELVQEKLPDWSGTHRAHSMVALYSPDGRVDLRTGTGTILDVAPTLADFAQGRMPGVQGRSMLA